GIMGMREGGTAKLEEAVAALREALKERTRERAPLRWAATQDQLGIMLKALGERESGTAKLEEAVTAFRQALTERTVEVARRGWIASNWHLGDCLALIADRSRDPSRAGEAIEALALARDAAARLSAEPLKMRVEDSLFAAYFGRARLFFHGGSLA